MDTVCYSWQDEETAMQADMKAARATTFLQKRNRVDDTGVGGWVQADNWTLSRQGDQCFEIFHAQADVQILTFLVKLLT